MGQVVYAIHHEMAYTLEDLLLRRTGIGLLGYPGEDVVRLVAAVAADELGWDRERVTAEIASASKRMKLPE